jgi:hypothetical protein
MDGATRCESMRHESTEARKLGSKSYSVRAVNVTTTRAGTLERGKHTVSEMGVKIGCEIKLQSSIKTTQQQHKHNTRDTKQNVQSKHKISVCVIFVFVYDFFIRSFRACSA